MHGGGGGRSGLPEKCGEGFSGGGADTEAEFSEMCKYAPDGPGIPGRGNSVRTRQGPVEHIQGERPGNKDGQGIGVQ